MKKKIRVRYPPSPTGFCHVGTARMAILNFLFAKKNGGEIIFRIEDTDKERSSKEFEEDLIESFTWLGLTWDEFYRQSERTDVYRDAIQKLIDADRAYLSEEESKKEPGTMVHVVRLRNPGTRITFHDVVRGEISFDTTELGDFAIARSLEDPLYHLSVVVDDEAMGITHVIRGEDHISNTPRQILIQEALGYERPHYAHYPLHLGSDRSKLSKRKGDVSVRDYRAKGYLPEALTNYLATLGWTSPSGREIMTLEEMIPEFQLEDIHKSGAIFDLEKLRWFNREYILKLSPDAYIESTLSILQSSVEERGFAWDEVLGKKILPILRERIHVWSDIQNLVTDGELDYIFAEPSLDAAKIPGKGSTAEKALLHLSHLRKLLEAIPSHEHIEPEKIKALVWEYAEQEGRGAVLWPLRYALTGKEKSPDPFSVATIIGKDVVLKRIETAQHALKNV